MVFSQGGGGRWELNVEGLRGWPFYEFRCEKLYVCLFDIKLGFFLCHREESDTKTVELFPHFTWELITTRPKAKSIPAPGSEEFRGVFSLAINLPTRSPSKIQIPSCS
jgi:hypothetical protein